MSIITPSEELLKYEQEEAIAIWEAPLSPQALSAVSEIDERRTAVKAKAARVGQDMGVGNNGNNDGSILPPLPKSLGKFKNWQDVAASMNRKCYKIAGLDPMKTGFDPDVWAAYSNKFTGMPFFEQVNFSEASLQITELSVKPLVEIMGQMLQAYLTPTGLADILNSVKKIAELATTNQNQTQKETHVQSGLIAIHASEVYLCNVRTSVSFTERKGKGYHHSDQQLILQRFVGRLGFGKCERGADQINGWDQTDITEWEKSTASYSKSPNQSPAWNN